MRRGTVPSLAFVSGTVLNLKEFRAFDALLYLGPPSAMTVSRLSQSLCSRANRKRDGLGLELLCGRRPADPARVLLASVLGAGPLLLRGTPGEQLADAGRTRPGTRVMRLASVSCSRASQPPLRSARTRIGCVVWRSALTDAPLSTRRVAPRNPELRLLRKAETLRHDAHDSDRPVVEADLLTDDRRRRRKALRPQIVAQDDHRSCL